MTRSARRAAFLRRLAHIPPFTSQRLRRWLLRTNRAFKRQRRHAFECLGSARYSRPAPRMQEALEPHLPACGFFVEAGAHDGYTGSNTYFLERFCGWSGVLVEPIPELYRRCLRERPGSTVINCALVSVEFQQPDVVMRYGGSQSVVKGAWAEVADEGRPASQLEWSRRGCSHGWEQPYDVRVPARTLTSVLDEADAPRIDLLSLDVEGYELEVLRGLDIDRYRPGVVVVEFFETFARHSLRDIELLLGPGYECLERLSASDWAYRRRD
jgi:FkbM family methyltransferase